MKSPGSWLLVFLALTFSPFSLASALSAQPFTPVFSKEYTRAAGRPVAASDAFTVCDPGGTFRLVVLNGPGGQERVSAGSIVVNGLEVIQEQDFKHRVARIERPLSNLHQDNQLEVRVRGRPDGAIQVTIEGIQACGIRIRITSPASGSVLDRATVLVRGEVFAPLGTEVGMTVNGVVAAVSKGEFAAFVPLELGPNTITARLVDALGTSASAAITISVTALQEDPLRLLASPSRGLSPLTVQLEPSSLLKRPIVRFELDFEGDGVVDLVSATLERVSHVYTQERLFVPTVTVTDDLGNRTNATAIVNVFSLPDLVAKWNAMKDGLRRGDIQGALSFIAEESRDRYRGIFTTLAAELSQIDSILTDIQLIAVRRDEAEFAMLRVSADGVERSFYILFVRDNDGIWRLRTF